MTYGTFGMWGSLLGKDDRLTVFPKDFIKTDVGKEEIVGQSEYSIFVKTFV